jgi:hypothetical protein
MISNRCLFVAALAAGLVALGGCSSNNAAPSQTIATGTVSGKLTTSTGAPVVGATITTIPDVTSIVAAPAPSGADGSYSISLPTGVYSIVFSGPGVTRTQVDNITVLVGQAVALDETLPYSPIVLKLSTPPNPAGFGMPVSLTATATGATGPLTYTWTVTTPAPAAWKASTAYKAGARATAGTNVYECTTAGTSGATAPTATTTTPDSIADGTAAWMWVGTALAAPSVTKAGDGSQASFTTDTLAAIAGSGNVKALDIGNRPSLVPITVGQVDNMTYTVKVVVTDSKYSQNTTTTVAPASYSHGTRDAPVGAMIVASDGEFVSNSPWASFSWTLSYTKTDTSTVPPTVTTTDISPQLNGAATENPWFIAANPGDYTLTDTFDVPAWATGTTYAKNSVVRNNGNIYACTTAGTSAGSGTGPSGTGTSITDGTAKWQFIKPFAPDTITVHADTFSGIGVCAACHTPGNAVGAPSDQYAAWPNSAHGNFNWKNPSAPAMTLFQAGINGIASSHYSGTCVKCHVVGYDVGETGNDGFSDRALADGWTFPAKLDPSNFTNLPADLKQLNGIQCENCHGPIGLASGGAHQPDVTYNAGVCARCHDEAPNHDKYQLWARSPTGHSNRNLALRGAADRSPANLTPDPVTGYASYGAGSCARCHTAQGFAAYVKQQQLDQCAGAQTGEINAIYSCYLNPPGTNANTTLPSQTALNTYLQTTLGLVATNVEPQTCQACHDPHTTGLRLEDDTHMLPSGFRVTNAGAGALCMLCHNSRNGARGDNVTAFPYSSYTINGTATPIRTVGTPHDQTAADIFSGNNAFFTVSYPGKHLQYVTDTCVGCHVNLPGLSGSTASNAPNHTFRVDGTLCVSCHSNATSLNDPATGTQATFDTQMTAMSTSLGNAAFAGVSNFIAINSGTNGALQIKLASGNKFGVANQAASTSVTTTLSDIKSIAGPAGVSGQSTSQGQPSQSSLVVTFNSSSTNGGLPLIVSLTNITWVGNDQNGVANAGRPIFSPSGLLARAIYNNVLLVNDGSRGVHNATYVFNTITNTKTVLDAYHDSAVLPAGVTAP